MMLAVVLGTFAVGMIVALSSAVCWAGFDIARKRLGRDMSASAAVAGIMLWHAAFIVPFLGAAEVFGVRGAGDPITEALFVGVPQTSVWYWGYTGASVVLNLAANFLFLRAVQISPLSLTTPYLAFTPVFSAGPAYWAFGEVPTNLGLGGIVTVCLGAFFLNPGDRSEGFWAPLKALWSERGSLYMLVVAALWSVTPVFDKAAAAATSPMWHTLMLSLGVAVVFIVVRAKRPGGLAELWREWGAGRYLVAGSGLFAVAAMVLQLTAYDFIEVAYVETVKRAVGVIGAIVAGWILFGESKIARRLLGAVVMTVGVVMIVIGG